MLGDRDLEGGAQRHARAVGGVERRRKAIDQPAQMLRIKNDPKYNEQWPRALVPYKRIYGVDEPARLALPDKGKRSPHLPEGAPFGLVGAGEVYLTPENARGIEAKPDAVVLLLAPGCACNSRRTISNKFAGPARDGVRDEAS